MIKVIAIILFVLKELYGSFLTYIRIKGTDRELPDNVKDVYDEEEFNRWKSYKKENIRLGIINDIVGFILNISLISFNLYAALFYVFNVNDYLKYLWLLAITAIIGLVVSLPTDYYDTFVIEEKYGFNKSTKMTFSLDKIKSLILGVIVSSIPIFIIKYLYDKFGNRGAILIILSLIAVSLILALCVMQILKIFNKFKPLEDGELKDRIIALCEKYDIKVKRIVVKDASRRTTKANAFCTGFGKKKTISLDDNLVNNYSIDEIVAVFAHEFAHAKYKHTLKTLPFGIFRMVFLLVVFIVLLNFESISLAFGFREMNYMIVLLVLGLIIWPIEILLDYIANLLSRKNEYEADAFTAKEGYGEMLISALKKLNKESLSDINPHPLIVKLTYSHPTLSERITAIRKAINE